MSLKMNILMVDDEPDAADLFRQKFRREIRKGEVDLHVASSGQQALEMLENLHNIEPLMILSDINMPGMTGIELLKEIKTTYPGLKVVMVSAYAGNNDYEEDAHKHGADDFMAKPIDFGKLKGDILE